MRRGGPTALACFHEKAWGCQGHRGGGVGVGVGLGEGVPWTSAYGAYQHSIPYGGVLLFVYGLGASLPVLVFGATAAKLASRLAVDGLELSLDRVKWPRFNETGQVQDSVHPRPRAALWPWAPGRLVGASIFAQPGGMGDTCTSGLVGRTLLGYNVRRLEVQQG